MIKRLDPKLIQKIAAGEVIESPSSVVKELLENSLDAGANQIEILILNGGKDLIAIKDNGSGMTRDDLLLCFERHTTSKIISEDDLYNISTMGFRGEALASIASVSRLTITSKHISGELAHTVFVTEEKLQRQQNDNLSAGTMIIVKDLFYNLPVRRNFMKSSNAESRKIIDLIKAYSLIKKEIHFKLVELDDNKDFSAKMKEKDYLSAEDISYTNKDVIIDSPRANSLLDKVVAVFNYDVAKNLLELNGKDELIFIDGVISKPTLYRATKSNIFVYVNGRFVNNKTITDAVVDAYAAILSDKFPFAVVNVVVPKSFVDVNVHPQKLELKFVDDAKVYSAVYNSITSTLKSNSLIPNVFASNNFSRLGDFVVAGNSNQNMTGDLKNASSQTYASVSISRSFREARQTQMQSMPKYVVQNTLENNEIIQSAEHLQADNVNILGQFANSYILAQKDDRLMIIDQHVVEERINYERLNEEFKHGSIKKQMLLQPIKANLSIDDAKLVSEKKELFDHYGIDIEQLDSTTTLIRSLPYVLKDQVDYTIVYDILEQVRENQYTKKNVIEDIKDEIIKQIACKASIKQGNQLTLQYMRDIVAKLFKMQNPYVCPHGRPVIIEFSLDDFNKMFKRK